MLVKVTHPMVKFLKENSKFKDLYSFSYEEINQELYQLHVDSNIWNNEIDYNPRTNKMKFIKVTYPDGYYACPKCITTKDLNKCLMGFSGKVTAEEFINAFDRMVEI